MAGKDEIAYRKAVKELHRLILEDLDIVAHFPYCSHEPTDKIDAYGRKRV